MSKAKDKAAKARGSKPMTMREFEGSEADKKADKKALKAINKGKK